MENRHKTDSTRTSGNSLRSVQFLLKLFLAFMVFPGTSAPAETAQSLEGLSSPVEYTAKPGDEKAVIVIPVTNRSPETIMIKRITTHCSCITARFSNDAGFLPPGAKLEFIVTMDLRRKSGLVIESVTLETSTAAKTLVFKVQIPRTAPNPPPPVEPRSAG